MAPFILLIHYPEKARQNRGASGFWRWQIGHFMKILQLNGAKSFAGAEHRLIDICRGLQNRGHQIGAATRDDTPLLPALQAAKIEVRALAPGGFDPKRIWKLSRWLRKFDLLHAHAGRDYVPALVAGFLARRPVVLHRHLFLPMHTFTAKLAQKRAAAVIAVSPPVVESLLKDGIAQNKIHLVPMFVDLTRLQGEFEPKKLRRELGAEAKKLVLSVGHLHPSKGHEDLLRAFVGLENVVLAIAGDGPQRANLEKQIGALKLENHAHLLGERDDIPALLKAADIFCLLSTEDPFPGAIIEAMGAGLPVVACNAGGVPQIVDDEKTGILVAPHAPDQAARALKRILEDDNLARKMGDAGKTRAESEFSFEQTLDAFEVIYRTATEKTRR